MTWCHSAACPDLGAGAGGTGSNISLQPDFNEMVGFTEPEVRHLVETNRDLGVFNQDVDTAMDIMGQWYNGYRFAKAAETDLYNTDMVLYYLKHSIPNRGVVRRVPRPGIPNQTVKQLMYGYLRDAYRDVGVFSVNLFRVEQLLMAMANRGEWRPVFDFLGEAVTRQTGVRDFISGEKVVQASWPPI